MRCMMLLPEAPLFFVILNSGGESSLLSCLKDPIEPEALFVGSFFAGDQALMMRGSTMAVT